MFEMAEPGGSAMPLRVACWPEKFFNLNENPTTTDLDLSTVEVVKEKVDGSLISSFLHRVDGMPVLRLKSRQSLVSSQAVDSLEWLVWWGEK